jgi:hypothetical protein
VLNSGHLVLFIFHALNVLLLQLQQNALAIARYWNHYAIICNLLKPKHIGEYSTHYKLMQFKYLSAGSVFFWSCVHNLGT